MILIDFRGFGCNKKAKALWIVLLVYYLVHLSEKRNVMIFEGKLGSAQFLWDRVCSLASFWVSVSTPEGITLFVISRDCRAMCYKACVFRETCCTHTDAY